jgi:integrase
VPRRIVGARMGDVRRVSKYPVVRTAFPRIVNYTTGPLRAFLVDARRRGNGRRFYFRRLEDAQRCAKRLALQHGRLGDAILNLTQPELAMAIECNQLLLPFGRSIRDATQHLITHLTAENERAKVPLVSECTEQFIAARQQDATNGELAPRSLTSLTHSMRRVAADVGKLPITEFGTAAVTTFLSSFSNRRTRSNWRLRLSNLFAFSQRKGWIEVNPCATIKVKVPESDIKILSLDQVERLLHAVESADSDLLAFVAFSLWGFMRVGEIQGLRWEHVNLEDRTIEVRAETSKVRSRRFTAINDTLAAWIGPLARKSGQVIESNFRKRWERATKGIELSTNVLRHTAISYGLAYFSRREWLAEQAGTSAQVITESYRRPLPFKQGEVFYALRPTLPQLSRRSS